MRRQSRVGVGQKPVTKDWESLSLNKWFISYKLNLIMTSINIFEDEKASNDDENLSDEAVEEDDESLGCVDENSPNAEKIKQKRVCYVVMTKTMKIIKRKIRSQAS
jgi:hypothetical protein